MTDDAYFNTIAERFLSLRGAPLFLSPADFLILSSWRSAGIPAAVVLDALEDVFSKRAKRNERGSVPLRYCRPAVEEAWKELRELVAPGVRGDETVAEAISRLTGLE